jgi:hypothetical protein
VWYCTLLPIVAGFLSTHNNEKEAFRLGFTFYYYNNASIRAATTMSAEFFSQNHNSCPSHGLSYYYPLPFVANLSPLAPWRQSAICRTLGIWISRSKEENYFLDFGVRRDKNRARENSLCAARLYPELTVSASLPENK